MSEPAGEFAGAIDRGLENVVACTTSISTISGSTLALPRLHDRGSGGALELRGGRLSALARKASHPRRARALRALAAPQPGAPAGGLPLVPRAADPGAPDGLPARGGGRAVAPRSRRQRDRRRGQRAQGDPPDRAAGDDHRGLPPGAQRPVAAAADPGSLDRVELPLHAARPRARSAPRPPARHLPDPARRPRAERLGVLRARHLEHALGPLLERDGRDRNAEGSAARRGERAGDAHAARDRLAGPDRGLARRGLRRQGQDHGLRTPRLQGRRSARAGSCAR